MDNRAIYVIIAIVIWLLGAALAAVLFRRLLNAVGDAWYWLTTSNDERARSKQPGHETAADPATEEEDQGLADPVTDPHEDAEKTAAEGDSWNHWDHMEDEGKKEAWHERVEQCRDAR
ncbi:hypothetical protein ABIC83_002822 [Roseateles asaccharophilus]|uniref:hypothetical protein n=1 Tax=Roseateles asaccharophilus TaxID=582607 RepID=UPI003833E072